MKVPIITSLLFTVTLLAFVGFKRNKETISNDTPSKDSLLTKGATLYTLNCSGCHGPNREGKPPTFPSLVDITKRMSQDEVRVKIKNGGEGMPALKHLSGDDINAIIAFLWNSDNAQQLDSVQAQLQLSLATQGKMIFQSHCASCHPVTADQQPSRQSQYMCRGMSPPPLAGITKRISRQAFDRILDIGPCYMPSFEHFSKEQRDALWAYLDSLSQNLENLPSHERQHHRCGGGKCGCGRCGSGR